MRTPRLAFVACHLPYPPISGGRRRELELIRRVAHEFDVHLLVASKSFEADRRNARHMERYCTAVEVFAAEPPRAREQGRAALPEQVLRHSCRALGRRVEELLATDPPDVLHVEGYYLMQHVPEDPGVPVVLAEQNVEYELDRQRAAVARRADGDLQVARAARSEQEAWRRADVVVVVTPEDRAPVQAAHPGADVRIVPDGADHLPLRGPGDVPAERPDAPLVVFLGNFAYAPNVDGAVHLCRDVLPLLRTRVPDAHVWLVGNAPPAEVRAL